MYEIVSGGALVALCEKPRFVKRNEETGVFVEASVEEAVGVAVNGTLYNLLGGTAIEGAQEAIVREGEAAEYVFQNRVRIAEDREAAETAVVEVEDALCEMDANTDQRMTDVENALCELDEIINGGGSI